MIDPNEDTDSPFIHRTTKQESSRNISHCLIERPLQTADAPTRPLAKLWGWHRLLLESLLAYLEEIITNRQANQTITIMAPQFIPAKKAYNFLHMKTADMFHRELLSKPGVVITNVPYQIP